MTRAVDKYSVLAYKSPYTEQLFDTANKKEFEKHLRQERSMLKARTLKEQHHKERCSIWSAIRKDAISAENIPKMVKKRVTGNMLDYYRVENKDEFNFKFLDISEPKNLSLYHECPRNNRTNWGGHDVSRPTSKIGIAIKTSSFPTEIQKRAASDSGIFCGREEFFVFADDWTFVARKALWGALNKKINQPDTGKSVSNEVFWNDLDQYAIQEIGMSFNDLNALYASGIMTETIMNTMAETYNAKKLGTLPPSLELDENFTF